MVVLEVQDDAYPSRGLWGASIRVVPDVPSNPADDKLTRADEFAAAGRCVDPEYPSILRTCDPFKVWATMADALTLSLCATPPPPKTDLSMCM